jgi:hypothetical protein
MRNTGTIYAGFKSAGRTRWKNLGTDDVNQARELLAGEMKQEAKVDFPIPTGLHPSSPSAANPQAACTAS